MLTNSFRCQYGGICPVTSHHIDDNTVYSYSYCRTVGTFCLRLQSVGPKIDECLNPAHNSPLHTIIFSFCFCSSPFVMHRKFILKYKLPETSALTLNVESTVLIGTEKNILCHPLRAHTFRHRHTHNAFVHDVQT